QRRFLLYAEKNQPSSVDRPENRQRKVAREFRVCSDRGLSKVVPEFQRKRNEREHVDSDGKNAELDSLLFAGFIGIFLCGPQRNSKAANHQQVACKSLIEKKGSGRRRKKENAESGNREKHVAELAQEVAECTETRPNEDRTFHRENERDPFPFEANRNGQRSKC